MAAFNGFNGLEQILMAVIKAKMKDKSDDDRLAKFLYHVRYFTDFISHCVDDLPRHKAINTPTPARKHWCRFVS